MTWRRSNSCWSTFVFLVVSFHCTINKTLSRHIHLSGCRSRYEPWTLLTLLHATPSYNIKYIDVDRVNLEYHGSNGVWPTGYILVTFGKQTHQLRPGNAHRLFSPIVADGSISFCGEALATEQIVKAICIRGQNRVNVLVVSSVSRLPSVSLNVLLGQWVFFHTILYQFASWAPLLYIHKADLRQTLNQSISTATTSGRSTWLLLMLNSFLRVPTPSSMSSITVQSLSASVSPHPR